MRLWLLVGMMVAGIGTLALLGCGGGGGSVSPPGGTVTHEFLVQHDAAHGTHLADQTTPVVCSDCHR